MCSDAFCLSCICAWQPSQPVLVAVKLPYTDVTSQSVVIIRCDVLLRHWRMFIVRMAANVSVILEVRSHLHIGRDTSGSLCAVCMCYVEVHFCFKVLPFLLPA